MLGLYVFNIITITKTTITVLTTAIIINIYHYMYNIGLIRAGPVEGHKDDLRLGAPLL